MKKVLVIFLFMMFCIPLPALAQEDCVSTEWRPLPPYNFPELWIKNNCSGSISIRWCFDSHSIRDYVNKDKKIEEGLGESILCSKEGWWDVLHSGQERSTYVVDYSGFRYNTCWYKDNGNNIYKPSSMARDYSCIKLSGSLDQVRLDQARIARAHQDIRALEVALNLYKLDNLAYPTTEQGLQSLVEPPSADLPNFAPNGYFARLPIDPWNNPYQYLSPGVHGDFDVFSYGGDGQPGGEGVNADIGNW